MPQFLEMGGAPSTWSAERRLDLEQRRRHLPGKTGKEDHLPEHPPRKVVGRMSSVGVLARGLAKPGHGQELAGNPTGSSEWWIILSRPGTPTLYTASQSLHQHPFRHSFNHANPPAHFHKKIHNTQKADSQLLTHKMDLMVQLMVKGARWLGVLVVSTLASHLQGWGLESRLHRVCGVCMFSSCLGGFLRITVHFTAEQDQPDVPMRSSDVFLKPSFPKCPDSVHAQIQPSSSTTPPPAPTSSPQVYTNSIHSWGSTSVLQIATTY
ncbi:hypothetical protein QTP86_003207 [Hemibagrus guttatus]|nr:hypothetical protein QTP86_003207 [Hemibagrus guttatus]